MLGHRNPFFQNKSDVEKLERWWSSLSAKDRTLIDRSHNTIKKYGRQDPDDYVYFISGTLTDNLPNKHDYRKEWDERFEFQTSLRKYFRRVECLDTRQWPLEDQKILAHFAWRLEQDEFHIHLRLLSAFKRHGVPVTDEKWRALLRSAIPPSRNEPAKPSVTSRAEDTYQATSTTPSKSNTAHPDLPEGNYKRPGISKRTNTATAAEPDQFANAITDPAEIASPLKASSAAGSTCAASSPIAGPVSHSRSSGRAPANPPPAHEGETDGSMNVVSSPSAFSQAQNVKQGAGKRKLHDPDDQDSDDEDEIRSHALKRLRKDQKD